MCEASARMPRRGQRPRWCALYGAGLLPLAALAVVEAVSPAGALRMALRCTCTTGAFALLALWIRSNRAALDLQQWCACAPATVTVRVVESRLLDARPPELSPPLWTGPSRELVSH
jgi:hypothetical protein